MSGSAVLYTFDAGVLAGITQPGGSIAAGGRYDNLAGMYYGNRNIPCVSVSLIELSESTPFLMPKAQRNKGDPKRG